MFRSKSILSDGIDFFPLRPCPLLPGAFAGNNPPKWALNFKTPIANGQRRDLSERQRAQIFIHVERHGDRWREAREKTQEAANRKRSRAAKERERDEQGKLKASGCTKGTTTGEAVERKSKAAAAGTGTGAIAKAEALENKRPDLAEQVRAGAIKPAEADRQATNATELSELLSKQAKQDRAKKAVDTREQKAGRKPILEDNATPKISTQERSRSKAAKAFGVSERKAGELLAAMELKAGRPKENSNTVLPFLSDLGIEKMQSSRWQRSATIPDDEFEQHQKANFPKTAGVGYTR